MKKIYDLAGQRFGRLIALKYIGRNSQGRVLWLCKCECGREKITLAKTLKKKGIHSCGCFQREISSKKIKEIKFLSIISLTTHGMTGSRPYRIWKGIKTRCNNPNIPKYTRYGGRGITYDSRWQKFEEFWKDMKERYANNLSIDRIDNDKGYFKENCKWSTAKEQSNNQSTNKLIAYNGKTQTLARWADELQIKYFTLATRLNLYHWSVEKAFTTKLF